MADDTSIIVHPFDADNQNILTEAYERLLAIRESAVAATKAFIDDEGYFSGVLVDSLIGGVMEHFQEVVRMPDDHIREMTKWGMVNSQPIPRTYIDERLSNLEGLVRHLSAPAPSPTQPPAEQASVEGRPPGKGRA